MLCKEIFPSKNNFLQPNGKMPAIRKIDFSIEKRASIALGKFPPFLKDKKISESISFQVDSLCTLPFSRF